MRKYTFLLLMLPFFLSAQAQNGCTDYLQHVIMMHKHYQMMAHVNILIFLVFVEVIVQFKGAINAATAGDVISIPAGTYAESLTIDKSISLSNPSVILDVSGLVTGISILEDVNNVVIDGLSITGFQQEAESQLTLALLMLQFLTM